MAKGIWNHSQAVCIIIVLLAVGGVHADVIHLKSGGKMEGIIQEETKERVKIKTKLGAVVIARERIASIEVAEADPLTEYKYRSEAIEPGDARSHLDLAAFCKAHRLYLQTKEQLQAAVAIVPKLEQEVRADLEILDDWIGRGLYENAVKKVETGEYSQAMVYLRKIASDYSRGKVAEEAQLLQKQVEKHILKGGVTDSRLGALVRSLKMINMPIYRGQKSVGFPAGEHYGWEKRSDADYVKTKKYRSYSWGREEYWDTETVKYSYWAEASSKMRERNRKMSDLEEAVQPPAWVGSGDQSERLRELQKKEDALRSLCNVGAPEYLPAVREYISAVKTLKKITGSDDEVFLGRAMHDRLKREPRPRRPGRMTGSRKKLGEHARNRISAGYNNLVKWTGEQNKKIEALNALIGPSNARVLNARRRCGAYNEGLKKAHAMRDRAKRRKTKERR